ncbi:cilia- and flagella-associated protein 107 [Pseudophryne corroboree]|uniref:cilia- and flagella-associated protein 107 n=1 Tax=Pseudophryne corroboree TaxID=495146 RepID=UPI003081F877
MVTQITEKDLTHRTHAMAEYPGSKKWSLPGWRIEQRYNNKVLIGNWVEERKKFKRSNFSTTNSCYGIDFVRFPDSKPDRIQRRFYLKRMEGLPKQQLLSHHGEPNSRCLVSLYDDHFIRHGNTTLPPLRSWDGNSLTWAPERSDFPVEDPPTNFGLLQEKQKLWRDQAYEDQRSVYSASYGHPPPSAFMTSRYGTAPHTVFGTSQHSNNNTNKASDFKFETQLQVLNHLAKQEHVES